MHANTEIFGLSDRFVDAWCALKPAAATSAGVAGFDDSWGDFSPSGIDLEHGLLDSTLQQLSGLGPTTSTWDVLARRVLADFLEINIAAIEHGDPFRDLNNVASSLQTLRETFDLMPTETTDDWTNITARLNGLTDAVEGYRQRLEIGRSQGSAVPSRQVLAGVHQARSAAGPYSPLQRFLTNSPAHARAGVEESLDKAHQAFGNLADYLEKTYLPSAPEHDAVGEERYRRHSMSFLGTDVDFDPAYRWGWDEVARLRQEMVAVGHQIDRDLSLDHVLAALKHQPQHAAPNAAAFLHMMVERQQHALEELEGVHFDVPVPTRDIEVELAPPGGALGAYYTPPSEDFRRRGTIWYAFEDDAAAVPLYDHISTAYHEGFPGHHLQIGVQMSLADSLSRFHRLLSWSPGYGEGWALYTELLMDELGYLERPEYRLGMLAAQMLRACRVVIDMGIHLSMPIPAGAPLYPSAAWTPEIAVEMLTDWAFLDTPYAESEVTRYLGWPAQAISYKLGEQAILDLRAQEMRHDGFDLKHFHAQVLGSGPVGLDHLRQIIAASRSV